MLLSEPVTKLKGVGPALASTLETVGIRTIFDLLLYAPRRYDDYSRVVAVNVAKPGQITVKGRLERVSARYVRRGLHVTEAVINDGTGKLKAVWFNQPYRSASLPRDADVYLAGKLERISQSYGLSHPSVERVSSFTKDTARIVPVYPETKDIQSGLLRRLIREVLPALGELPDNLPASLIKEQDLMGWPQAARQIHFPDSMASAEKARERFEFDELFALMLAHTLFKRSLGELKASPIAFDETLAKDFVARLPFKLTDAQRVAAWQILQDMALGRPMNRLLQGDVGSGKTVVAAFAALMAAHGGYQTAVMAPTEVLAQQHALTFEKLLKPFRINQALLTGSLKAAEKKRLHDLIAGGETRIVVGTHALIQKGVKFKDLGLIVVDEQHRFGVRQRQALVGKSGISAHVLSMSATPIPRSLTLTLYGELDASVIDELPPGRKPVLTRVVPGRSREEVVRHVDAEIGHGRQCYVICPLIEDSDYLGVKSVTSEYERLQKTVFSHRRIGLLHGKLTAAAKAAVLDDFKAGRLDILLSTTVVEVGVDVPNASVLIVEAAERFGLSQLHQLRGRVGRGEHQSYCYLMTDAARPALQRLSYLERTQSGFELAEADLKLRGPGEVYGTRQHGDLDLRLARLTDLRLIARVQQAVTHFMEAGYLLESYPVLAKRVERQKTLAHLN
jgi:ATP-dependent DNA helicase RecG